MITSFARKHRAVRPLCAAITIAFAGFATCADATTVVAPNIGQSRVLLPPGVYKPGEAGVQLLHDYGAFQLYRIDAAHAVELASVSNGEHNPLSNTIEFNAEPLDSGKPFAVPSALQGGKSSGPALQIVQFVGPIADEWLDALRATGARILQYIPDNAYVVRADESALNKLAEMARDGNVMQFTTDYAPYYRLDARLGQRVRAGLSAANEIDVTVQVVGGFDNSGSKQKVLAVGKAAGSWFPVMVGEAIRLRVRESAIVDLARIADVFAVEEYLPPRKLDEVQDQIIAGNFNGTQSGPSGPGYLAWLSGLGFPTTQSSYPVVDVADDGVGTGVAAVAAGDVVLRVNGNGANASRLLLVKNCTTSTAGDGKDGHGHLNTTIVGGYDARAGFPYVDPLGYQRGLGLNPFVNLTHSKIFSDAGNFELNNCGGSTTGLAKTEQNNGAYISSNSWGASVAGAYDTDAQSYDLATRDADAAAAGNQPMVFVFAAGNSGPGAGTVGSPGTGKNVITVGASENQRPTDEDGSWSDGCGIGPTGADNAMDVISFSSRGPASSSRKKPEIIAPGTHIQGSASTDGAAYTGNSVCDKYRPSGQTTFAASSGTSHSTPAMSGIASLVAYYLKTNFQAINPNYATAGVWPSAAAIKAYMMAHTTYLTGTSANDSLPSNNQGYGMPNLARAFDSTTLHYVNDQQNVLGATGATFTWTGGVSDTTKPLKIAMAFSDAPGATSGSPVVNNLDLTVTVGANTYKGNVFTGQYSVTGGSADAVDSYEAVFLPPGTSGNFTITVTATNIAGDGVPNNADTTDQDFALICSNCTSVPDFTVQPSPSSGLVCAGTAADFTTQVTSINGFASTVNLSATGLPGGASATFTPSGLIPTASSTSSISTTGVAGGTYAVGITGTSGAVTHSTPYSLTVSAGAAAAPALAAPANDSYGTSFTPALSWSAAAGALNYVVEIDDDPAFGSINYTATVNSLSHTVGTNLNPNTHYYWRVKAHNACGDTVSPVFGFFTSTQTCQTFASTDVPKSIPDNTPAGVNSTLSSALSGPITDVDVVNMNGTHTWINDLSFKLTSPANTSVAIMTQPCGSQDNFYLSLDDAAAGTWPCPPVNATPYPANTYKPSNALSGLNGGTANGTWTLNVADLAAIDTGTLQGWGLKVCAATAPTIVNAVDDGYNATEDTQLSIATASGVLANDLPAGGLTATTVTPPAHGSLTLNTDGSFVYVPAPDFCGADGFSYQATNGSSNDTAAVALTIACVNDAPVASNDIYSGSEDTPINASAPGVLANDTDVDSASLTAVVVTGPTHGLLTLNSDGSFAYSPAANYCGSDSFTYKANDGALDSTPATANIALTCVNDAPIATPESIALNQGATATTLVGSATSVLTNDSDVDAGDTLAAQLVTGPAHGTLTLNPDGTFSYGNNGSSNASDSFVYKACDNGVPSLCSANTTVTITVNLQPVAGCSVPAQVLVEGNIVNLALAGEFVDPEGQIASYGATGLPGGLSINSGTGQLTGTVAAGAHTGSPFTATISAIDAGGLSLMRNLSITVLATGELLFRNGFDNPADATACH